MVIQKGFSLKNSNTFGLHSVAERYVSVHEVMELQAALRHINGPIRILGGGSNILLTGDLEGWVIKNEIEGIEIVSTTEDEAIVAAGGGVVWHELVQWAIKNDLGGIENLSLIPGSVGAAPIQNIGAYGVELKDVFVELETVELATGEIQTFTAKQCRFNYRDSFFKQEGKGKFFITKVMLRLTRRNHKLNLEYGAIRQTLEENGITEPTIRQVSEAVIHIRRSKLPDPALIGNSGSFFKNPEVGTVDFQRLKSDFSDIVHYDLPNGKVKIPAGWLIEHAGWKGKRIGDAGVHVRQALVLVNYGNAAGKEIHDLALQIQDAVFKKYGIQLEMEVNVW